jgi:hypothetical protein
VIVTGCYGSFGRWHPVFFLTIQNENLGVAFDIEQKRIPESGWLIATTDLNRYTQYQSEIFRSYRERIPTFCEVDTPFLFVPVPFQKSSFKQKGSYK